MYILVTLRTLCHKGLLETVIGPLELSSIVIRAASAGYAVSFKAGSPCRVKMGLVALQAQEWFLLLEEIVGNGSMGVMTDEAVLNYRIMLEYEWSLVACVALETKVIDPFIGSEHTLDKAAASVRIVAV